MESAASLYNSPNQDAVASGHRLPEGPVSLVWLTHWTARSSGGPSPQRPSSNWPQASGTAIHWGHSLNHRVPCRSRAPLVSPNRTSGWSREIFGILSFPCFRKEAKRPAHVVSEAAERGCVDRTE